MKPTEQHDTIFNKSAGDTNDPNHEHLKWTPFDTWQTMRLFLVAFVVVLIAGFLISKYLL